MSIYRLICKAVFAEEKGFTLAEIFSPHQDKQLGLGFTLAEVLITLGVIGVVAAITLPTLISNKQSKDLETGLKKGASIISQALDRYYAENGERLTYVDHNGAKIKGEIIKYFNVLEDCGLGYNDANSACIKNYGTDNENNSTTYKNYNGTNYIDLMKFDNGQFVLTDGSFILIENNYSKDIDKVYISIDVNGYKKRPNRLGQDLFMFQLDEKGFLHPMGGDGTTYDSDTYCSTSSTDSMNGAGCTYKALTEKDYFKNMP